MRNGLTTVLLLILIVVSSVSLWTHHPSDPSYLNSQTSVMHIQRATINKFGLMGANFAAVSISIFGIGAFWLPIMFLMGIRLVSRNAKSKVYIIFLVGGVSLMFSTGELFTFNHIKYLKFFNIYIQSSGIFGELLSMRLIRLIGLAGTIFLYACVVLFGFLITTDFIPLLIVKKTWRLIQSVLISWSRTIRTVHDGSGEQKKSHSDSSREKKNQKPIEQIEASEQIPKGFRIKNSCNKHFLPPTDLLHIIHNKPEKMDCKAQSRLTHKIEQTLRDFNIEANVVDVVKGPTVSTFKVQLAKGIKPSKVINAADDLALVMGEKNIRIDGLASDEGLLGIEIPNEVRREVTIGELICSDTFKKFSSNIPVCLGADVYGKPFIFDLEKMPHLLVAGTTGSGKSVLLNAIICGLLFKSAPNQVKFILIDPKRIEFSKYEGIPHLLEPIVMDGTKASKTLSKVVEEMEERNKLLVQIGAKNIVQYNQKIDQMVKTSSPRHKKLEKMPNIIVIVDEFADLVLTASADVEMALQRLGQMGRACGIHLILATQRPTVDIITGVIKANLPTRVALRVSSKTDSRIILDDIGAESLLGKGEMFLRPPDSSNLVRIQGAQVSETEIDNLVGYLRRQIG
jgi:DNA segregation ATPase FtsK/SpoIIIE, S-DNA-T family